MFGDFPAGDGKIDNLFYSVPTSRMSVNRAKDRKCQRLEVGAKQNGQVDISAYVGWCGNGVSSMCEGIAWGGG